MGAFGALFVMTAISSGVTTTPHPCRSIRTHPRVAPAALGVAAPMLLPRALTHWAGAALFLFFGAQLLWKAHSMPAGEGADEMAEARGAAPRRLGPPSGPPPLALEHPHFCRSGGGRAQGDGRAAALRRSGRGAVPHSGAPLFSALPPGPPTLTTLCKVSGFV